MVYLIYTLISIPLVFGLLPILFFSLLFPTTQAIAHAKHLAHHQSQTQTKREESTDLKLLQDSHGEICSLQRTPNFDPIILPEVKEGGRLPRRSREERWKFYREKKTDEEIAGDLKRGVEEQWEGGWGGDPSAGRQGRVVRLAWRG